MKDYKEKLEREFESFELTAEQEAPCGYCRDRSLCLQCSFFNYRLTSTRGHDEEERNAEHAAWKELVQVYWPVKTP